jgi:hypothetical protein
LKKIFIAITIFLLIGFVILDNFTLEIYQYYETIKYQEEYYNGIRDAKIDYQNTKNYKLIYFGVALFEENQWEKVEILDSLYNVKLDLRDCIVLGGEDFYAKGYNEVMISYLKSDFDENFITEYAFIFN